MPTKNLSLKIFDGSDGFQRIKPLWNKLLSAPEESYGFYHCTEWYEAFLDYLAQDPESFRFYGIFHNDELVAVFPLKRMIRRPLGIHLRSMELPDHSHMPLTDVILPHHSPSSEIWNFFLQQTSLSWDVLRIPNLPENATLASIPMPPTGTRALKLRNHVCYFRPRTTEAELTEELSPGFRKSLRNAHNRLAKEGPPTFSIAQTDEDMQTALAEFIRLEASGWKGRAGTAVGKDARLTGFYKKLANELGPERCLIDVLTVNETPIAAHFNMRTGDTVYSFKTGLDENYLRCSTGHLMIERTLTWPEYPPEEIPICNFVGNASWLLPWQPDAMNVFDLHIFNNTPAGLLAYTLHRLHLIHHRARNAVETRLRPNIRKALISAGLKTP